MDGVQAANSGHPGAPMGMADMAEVLWNSFLKHNPQNPDWVNKDRFVLSNGHASMLIYSLLHLTGYDLPIEELKNFRQMHSKTPGHPEYKETPGVQTTTGPLSQGVANAVGMALSEKLLAKEFNREGFNVMDHFTYVFLGDGCLMEGLSHEVCSLAGVLKLGKLICLYDDNDISIDGKVDGWFCDDSRARFESYGWQVICGVDGHDAAAVEDALAQAQAEPDKPTLIGCKTTIAYGSPNKGGTSSAHGSPLGPDEIALVRKELGWEHPAFEIPQDIYDAWNAKDKGAAAEAEWNALMDKYTEAYPELAAEFKRRMAGELPADFADKAAKLLQDTQAAGEVKATRKSAQAALDYFQSFLPEMLGGSADLTPSNGTKVSGSVLITPDSVEGNYISYGVREFGMAAMMNGMALHGGHIPYGGTFLVFSDYSRNAIRMAALMGLRAIQILTHDSIGVGEDGPTHQPVEHTSSLRLIPNLSVWRPCDCVEAAAAYQDAIERKDGPTALILTRQNVQHQERDAATVANIAKGGYVLVDCDGTPDAIYISTGSEVELCVDAAKELAAKGKKIRVVSMPCTESFDAQDKSYRDSVLPPAVTKRVAVEAGNKDFWYKYAGLDGAVIGMGGFGLSAPGGELFKHFGFTVDNVVKTLEEIL